MQSVETENETWMSLEIYFPLKIIFFYISWYNDNIIIITVSYGVH